MLDVAATRMEEATAKRMLEPASPPGHVAWTSTS